MRDLVAQVVVFDQADGEPLFVAIADVDGTAVARIDVDNIGFRPLLMHLLAVNRLAERAGVDVEEIPADLFAWAFEVLSSPEAREVIDVEPLKGRYL